MRRESEFRPGPSAVWKALLCLLFGWGVLLVFLTLLFTTTGRVSGVIPIGITLGAFFAVGLSGLHQLLQVMNCRIYISPMGIRYRNTWGKEFTVSWNEVRRIRWYGFTDDEGRNYHTYQIDTVRGDVNYDQSYPGFSQIERHVREKSDAQLEEMGMQDSLFRYKETSRIMLISLLATIGLVVLLVDRFGVQ